MPDLNKAVAWFDTNDVTYVKHPKDGKIKHVAFIKDPDDYWIEIVQANRMS